jgi:hypothetical protein
MNSMDDAKRRKAEVLKERFLEYFSARTTNTSRLQETVKGLRDQGVTRQTLIDWAVREKPLIVVWISSFSNFNEENLWLF